MKHLILAAVAATALVAGASAASAQNFQSDGPDYSYGRGRFVERGVGLRVGPSSTDMYVDGPAYRDDGYAYRRGTPDNSTENMRVFRSQEVWPQSPPGGS